MYCGLDGWEAGRLCDSASSGISPDSRPNGDTQLAEKTEQNTPWWKEPWGIDSLSGPRFARRIAKKDPSWIALSTCFLETTHKRKSCISGSLRYFPKNTDLALIQSRLWRHTWWAEYVTAVHFQPHTHQLFWFPGMETNTVSLDWVAERMINHFNVVFRLRTQEQLCTKKTRSFVR